MKKLPLKRIASSNKDLHDTMKSPKARSSIRKVFIEPNDFKLEVSASAQDINAILPGPGVDMVDF